MNIEQWWLQISASSAFGESQVGVLENFKSGIVSDEDLQDDEKLELESAIDEKIRVILEDHIDTIKEAGDDPDWLPSNYNIIVRDFVKPIKGFSAFNPEGLPFPQWYLKEYLPKFHPMPYAEIQHPLMACLALCNCAAILCVDGTWINPMPVVCCLGLRGTGKSLFVQQVMKLYPERYGIWTKPSWTGASIRDEIHNRLGRNKAPGIIVLDNYNPNVSLQRLGAHYDLVLSNNRNDAVSKVSTVGSEDRIGEFYTYGYKWITTVFDFEYSARDESKEMLRRMITLCFTAATPDEPVRAYSWCEFKDQFRSLWKNEEFLIKNYFPVLQQVSQMSPKHINLPDPSFWEICQVPIATGVAFGIWSTVWEAINHFQDYFLDLPKMKTASVKDLLTQVVDTFVRSVYPSLCRANTKAGFEMDENRIELAELRKFIANNGISVSKTDIIQTFPRLLSEYGYVSDTDDTGIIFVRGQ